MGRRAPFFLCRQYEQSAKTIDGRGIKEGAPAFQGGGALRFFVPEIKVGAPAFEAGGALRFLCADGMNRVQKQLMGEG